MSELEMLAVRLEMEALITQREALCAFNSQHQQGYSEDSFYPIADRLMELASRCYDTAKEPKP